jgi:hypothetical protein
VNRWRLGKSWPVDFDPGLLGTFPGLELVAEKIEVQFKTVTHRSPPAVKKTYSRT